MLRWAGGRFIVTGEKDVFDVDVDVEDVVDVVVDVEDVVDVGVDVEVDGENNDEDEEGIVMITTLCCTKAFWGLRHCFP